MPEPFFAILSHRPPSLAWRLEPLLPVALGCERDDREALPLVHGLGAAVPVRGHRPCDVTNADRLELHDLLHGIDEERHADDRIIGALAAPPGSRRAARQHGSSHAGS